jgi:membrane fusion protein, multidrug efflux system
VVASGLTPGMQVVSAGVHVLQSGQKVTLYQAARGTSSATPAAAPVAPVAAVSAAAAQK